MNKYTCKQCNAELYWDSSVMALKCEYCDSIYNPNEFNETNEQVGQILKENKQTTDDSTGITLVKYKCNECGAEVITAAGTLATICTHCGRALSMNKKMEGIFKPDFVIPFAINKKKAKEIYQNYLKSSFLVPDSFSDESELKKIKGVYVPFWLHSFKNLANAEFQCTHSSSRRKGNDKIITYQDYLVTMEAQAYFDKLPTDALKKMDNDLMDSLEPFDYDELEEFHAGYMAGFYAEEYDQDVCATLGRARVRAAKAMQGLMSQRVGAFETIRLSKYEDTPLNIKTDYAMLPVWIINAEYRGKKYTYAINGSSGKIVGVLPIDIMKTIIWGSVIAIILYTCLSCLMCLI